jgi:hypothetical protein
MDDNIFSGIPSLDDTQGLDQYVNNFNPEDFGLSAQVPAALQQQQQQQTPAQQTDPAGTPTAPAEQNTAPTFTSEQVAQIIAQMRSANQQPAQQPVARQPVPQPAAYTPQQANIIKQLVDRGVPLERIIASMNGNRQNLQQQQVMNRIQNIEQFLQDQQYRSEEANFINKMTTFGDKFGLSESELVTFGNKALAMGINLTNVSDVEAVFRAVYPEQYAIRSQRIAGASASQIYGGASAMETPRATSSKMEDAYVDAFLKQTMPNAYNMYSK